MAFDLFGGSRRIGHSLGRENHQEPVAVGVGGGDFDGAGIARGVAEKIDQDLADGGGVAHAADVADDLDRSVIHEQVEMGVAVRMACLDVLTRNLTANAPVTA